MPTGVRVAIVTHKLDMGGMERSMLRLYRCLKDNGFVVEFITTEQRGEWFGLISKLAPVRHIEFHPLGGLPHIFRVGQVLAGGDYDVVILFNARYAQAALRMLPDTIAAIPAIRSDTEGFYKVGLGNQSAWNAVVVNSPKLYAVARERLPHKPVICIPNGVELPDLSRLAERRGPDGTARLIFVGRLTRRKGVRCLAPILRRCLDAGLDSHLNVVGDGPERLGVLSDIKDAGLTARVKLFGSLSPDEVSGMLLDAHVLILPTQVEGFPNVVLEAQACGCVPVVSRLPGITDMMIDHGETGLLVDPTDIDGFVSAITNICSDSSKWSRMSKAGHLKVAQNFSFQRECESYSTLIRDVLRGRYPLPGTRKSLWPIETSILSWPDLVPPIVRKIVRWIRASLRLKGA